MKREEDILEYEEERRRGGEEYTIVCMKMPKKKMNKDKKERISQPPAMYVYMYMRVWPSVKRTKKKRTTTNHQTGNKK